MNKPKTSNLLRSIAFFLTAVVLTCTFGFTVDGWMVKNTTNNTNNANPSGNLISKDELPENSVTDEETDTEVPIIPVYINPLTGEETDEKTASATRYAFVLDPSSPLYGIDMADVIIELPTENERTRMLAISLGCDNLWKIGNILPSRGYISNFAKYFGANLISYGSDDQTTYNYCNLDGKHLDLSKNTNYCYTEQERFVYTNCDLVQSSTNILTKNDDEEITLPLNFANIGDEKITYETQATNVSLPISALYQSQLIYNVSSEKYSIIKNGEATKDHLSSKTLEFTNCFILFADSVTYDNAECSQMIMETIGSGNGFYITNGTVTEVLWSSSIDGELVLSTKDGTRLTVNCGRSYISFLKTSKSEYVVFS